jgi:hypothetical protein
VGILDQYLLGGKDQSPKKPRGRWVMSPPGGHPVVSPVGSEKKIERPIWAKTMEKSEEGYTK